MILQRSHAYRKRDTKAFVIEIVTDKDESILYMLVEAHNLLKV